MSKYLLNFNNRMGTMYDTEKYVAVSQTSKIKFLTVRGEFVSHVGEQQITDRMTRFPSHSDTHQLYGLGQVTQPFIIRTTM